MKHTKIKWVVSPYRKRIKKQDPIKPSKYYKYLCEIGAGFKGSKRKTYNNVAS